MIQKMELTDPRAAVTIRRIAMNVSDIVRKKQALRKRIEDARAKFDAQAEKLNNEIKALEEQQEMFEAPVRKLTGGYGTEDLVIMEMTETGTASNGKPIRSTVYKLKYPDTIIPPKQEDEPLPEYVPPRESFQPEIDAFDLDPEPFE